MKLTVTQDHVIEPTFAPGEMQQYKREMVWIVRLENDKSGAKLDVSGQGETAQAAFSNLIDTIGTVAQAAQDYVTDVRMEDVDE